MEPIAAPNYVLVALIAALVFTALKLEAVRQWRARTRGLPLPPGPRPLPIIGNLRDIPRDSPWERYRDMSKQYGDVMYLKALGQGILVISNTNAAFELLDKRSAIYSDRPASIVWSIVGSDGFLPFMRYGPAWREHRRLFWQHFHHGVVARHAPLQRDEVHKFLNRLLDDPARPLVDQLNLLYAAMILGAVYNLPVPDHGDRLLVTMMTATEGFIDSLKPGSSVVEFFPLLRFLPAWLPFQQQLARYRAATKAMKDMPYALAMAQREKHTNVPSMMELLLEQLTVDTELSREDEETVKSVAGIAYAGGGDTTSHALQTFFLAMSLHPEVQKKAQAELDRVLGARRLPEFRDRDELPYVNAVLMESQRWLAVSPLGFPHASVEDDEYNGRFIPAGTVILCNAWAMLHNPDVYPEPDEFRPERFIKDGRINPDVTDPLSFALGFGRRICPGRHFADSSIFITIASVLAVFDIGPPLDAQGQPIRIVPKQAVTGPEDCRCTITARSHAARMLIRESKRDW